MASFDGGDIDPGRVALVTGGGRGIGREIASVLADEGYRVCVAARSGDELDRVVGEITDAGGEARAYTADLRDVAAIDDLVAALRRDVGGVGVLVNNAGIGEGGEPLWEADPDRWWDVLAVNVRAPMRLTHHLLGGMVDRDDGYVVNVGSLGGARPAPMTSAYGASKAALARLTDSVARELAEADSAVRAFTVSPGLVRTDMTAGVPVFESLPDDAWTPIEEIGDLVRELVRGRYDDLSGRFLHVAFDRDAMRASADEIVEDDLYVLRLRGLDGVVE